MKRDGKVTVAGRNLVKKHVKRTETFAGGTVNKEMPIHRSNVRPVDPVTGCVGDSHHPPKPGARAPARRCLTRARAPGAPDGRRKAVRIATRFTEDGKKVRVTVGRNASGSILPKPAQLLERKKPRPVVDGPKDTAPDVVGRVTFDGTW